jgi:Cytochrome c554 and c-prime
MFSIVGIFLLIVGLSLVGCRQSSSQFPAEPALKDPLPIGQFVGSEACKRCHQEVCSNYAIHPMSYSTREVAHDNWRGNTANLPARVSGANRFLSAQLVDGQMIHSETMCDGDGEVIYEQQHPMKFVVGSGTTARAYLEERGDHLFMSPLNWYQKSKGWSLAPGYQADDVRRFDRRANEECLSCHAGRVEWVAGTFGLSRLAIAEESIGCERCHGAGSNHIDFHDSKLVSVTVDPIQNPASFSPAERDAVCYQCHLSASARVPRPGKRAIDFQVGQKLSDVWAILDYGIEVSRGERTRSVNHVQQMRDSQCFQKSGSQMSCTTCHDPHKVPQAQVSVEYYRQKCNTCHDENDCTAAVDLRTLTEDNCVECHMPRLDSSNMAHVAQTDHRILRKQVESEESTPSVLKYFAETAAEFNSEERQRGAALATYIHCTKKGIAVPEGLQEFLQKSLESFPRDVLLLNALGSISLKKQDFSGARRYYDRAVQIEESDEAALDGLLEVAYSQADWESCVRAASKLIEIDSSNVRAHAYRGDSFARIGKTAEGIKDLEVAVKLNPGEPIFRQWLVERYSHIGQDDNALRQKTILERIKTAKLPPP